MPLPTGRGWKFAVFHESGDTIGRGIVSATPEEVMSALQELPDELPWPAVAERVIPLFDRIRPYPISFEERVEAMVPPGLVVGFGVDLGPAFIVVSPALLKSWAMTPADLAAQALGNLHSIAALVDPEEVIDGPIGEVESLWLQTGHGIGSVLVLASTELARIFAAVPRLFIAPMRDVLIGLPIDTERDFAAWLFDEVASGDPNRLHPRAFAFDGRNVTVEPLAASRYA